MITASAIKLKENGKVFTGKRHDVVYLNNAELWVDRNIMKNKYSKTKPHIQGFITDKGEFLERVKAGEHAFLCGQIKKREDGDYYLISENLW